MAAGLFGSAILALALQRGRLTGEAAFDLSRLDEAFQEEQWGVDAEAAVRSRVTLRQRRRCSIAGSGRCVERSPCHAATAAARRCRH